MDSSNLTPFNNQTRHQSSGVSLPTDPRQTGKLPRQLYVPELTDVVEQTISSLAILKSKRLNEPNFQKILSLAQITDTVLAGNANCLEQDLIALLSARIKDESTSVPPMLRAASNYGIALTYGLDLVRRSPCEAFGLDAIRQIHRLLCASIAVRGEPGKFREQTHNSSKSSLTTEELIETRLRDFEDFVLINPPRLPFVQRLAMAYAHMEITAPFYYGNRDVARIILQMMLELAGYPNVPIATAFSIRYGHLDEELMDLRKTGNWLPWLEFFLTGFLEGLSKLFELAGAIQIVRAEWEGRLRVRSDAAARRIADSILVSPVTTVSDVQNQFGMSFQTANTAISSLAEAGIIGIIPGSKPIRRNRYFLAPDVIKCAWNVFRR